MRWPLGNGAGDSDLLREGSMNENKEKSESERARIFRLVVATQIDITTAPLMRSAECQAASRCEAERLASESACACRYWASHVTASVVFEGPTAMCPTIGQGGRRDAVPIANSVLGITAMAPPALQTLACD
eukprot:5916259-Pleurochrysis_carterae.AAC.3